MTERRLITSPALHLRLPEGWTLKGLKTFKTRDGEAFNATLLIDGKAVGTIEQEGHGGGTDFFPTAGYNDTAGYGYKAFNAEIDALYNAGRESEVTVEKSPVEGVEVHSIPLDFFNAETVLNDLVEEHDTARKLTRAIKTKTPLIKGFGWLTGEGVPKDDPNWIDYGFGDPYWPPQYVTLNVPLAGFLANPAHRKHTRDDGYTHYWSGTAWTEIPA